VRAAVAAGNTEVDEELGDGLGGHRRPAVGVEGELVAVDAVDGEGVGNERLSELAGLGRGDHPAHDVAAEDVDDYEQLEVDAAGGALQLAHERSAGQRGEGLSVPGTALKRSVKMGRKWVRSFENRVRHRKWVAFRAVQPEASRRWRGRRLRSEVCKPSSR
jgi:hypothetical protein